MKNEAPEALRNKRGEFATARDPRGLYSLVREVALVAAGRDDDSLKDPAAVTQRAWDLARHALTSSWGPIPRASEICRQLRDRSGQPYPWHDLLANVFDDSIDLGQHHAQRLSEPDRCLTDELVYWASNQVARTLHLESLVPSDYERGRERLLRRHAIGTRARAALERVLPNANQVISHCGSWDAALEIAKLQPRRPRGHLRDALSVPTAISFFYSRHGYLPKQSELHTWCRRESIACASPRGRLWEEWLGEACELIVKQGLPRPNPYPATTPPRDWRPLDVNTLGLPRRQNQARRTRFDALESVYEFKLNLAATESPTHRRYKAFARGRSDVLSLQALQGYGGLAALVAEVARPDWRERAHGEQIAGAAPEASTPSPRRLATAKAPTAPRRRSPEKRLAFLYALRDAGPLPSRALSERLGAGKTHISRIANGLIHLGLICPTEENPASPKQRYRLTPLGEAALRDEPALRERLARARVSVHRTGPRAENSSEFMSREAARP